MDQKVIIAIVVALVILAAAAFWYFSGSSDVYTKSTGASMWPTDSYACDGSSWINQCVLPAGSAQSACSKDTSCKGYGVPTKSTTLAPGYVQLTRTAPVSTPAAGDTVFWMRNAPTA